MHSPTDASPPSLRTATHGLGPIGSLLLHRIGLAPTAHCRSPGALRNILYVILDDGRLERLLAQLRYPQPYLASFGLQAALVVSGPGIPTRLAALIALRIAQPIRLGIEHCVQRLLHGTPHHPVEG